MSRGEKEGWEEGEVESEWDKKNKQDVKKKKRVGGDQDALKTKKKKNSLRHSEPSASWRVLFFITLVRVLVVVFICLSSHQ